MTQKPSSSPFGKQVTTSANKSDKPAKPAAPRSRLDRRQLELEDYIDSPMTEEQKLATRAASKKVRRGPISRAPMLCKDLQCPFLEYCTLKQENIPRPIGKPCPIEQHAVDQWTGDYYESLQINEHDPNAYLIGQIIQDLAIDLVLQSRIMMELGKNADVMVEETVGINTYGDPITNKKLHPGLQMLMNSSEKKMRKLRELLATPRAKAEAGRLGAADPATQAAEAQAKARQLKGISDGSGLKKINLLDDGED